MNREKESRFQIALAHVNESEAGEAERIANQREIDEAEKDLRQSPRIVVEGDVKRDWRFRMGFIEGLRRRDERILIAKESIG